MMRLVDSNDSIKVQSILTRDSESSEPGTDLEKRLNLDGSPKAGYEPINKVDNICMHDDYNYKLADEGIGTQREADTKMLE